MGKGEKLGFAENFMLSGVAAAVSKTAAAPIERVKLLVQNQGEMLKQGTLTEPYKGVLDCTARTMKSEGLVSFWRGKLICSLFSCILHRLEKIYVLNTSCYYFPYLIFYR